MIILTEPVLKFLLAGRAITVDVDRQYHKGRTYAVGISHKRSVCRALIVDVTERPDGWTLRIRQQTQEEPRLLAANPAAMRADYTHDPARAARGEPEALTDAQVRDLTAYRAALAHNGHTAQLLELGERMLADLDEALRTTVSRAERDRLRVLRHHAGRLGKAS